MKTLFNSLKENINQRLSNPFLGAFTTSWVLVNWKTTLYLFFSSDKIEDKISTIESYDLGFMELALYPTVSAIFITLILPWISYGIQQTQEYINTKRYSKKYLYEKNLLQAKRELVQEQIALDELKQHSEMNIQHIKLQNDTEIENRRRETEHQSNEQKMHLEQQKHDRELDAEERRERMKLDHEMQKFDREQDLQERKHEKELNFELEKKRIEREVAVV